MILSTAYRRISTEANRKLFDLVKLESLVLVSARVSRFQWILDPIDFGGFHNLKKLECTDFETPKIIELMAKASNLEFVRLRRSAVSFRLLEKAAEVTCVRNTPLHIVVNDALAEKWRREALENYPLLTVESETIYVERMGLEDDNWEREMRRFDHFR